MTPATFSGESPPAAGSSLVEPSRSRRYLFWLIGPVVVLYLIPLALVRLPLFQRWTGTRYIPALEYAFRLKNENADVVLFGDSSALLGISTTQMSTDLGANVINLPDTMGSLPVTGDMALRHYLKQNKPPRLIVFYLTAWDLDFSRQDNPFIFEGEEMLLLHGTAAEIARYAIKHPLNALAYPFQTYASLRKSAGVSPHTVEKMIAAAKGHLDATLIGASTPISGDCRLPDSELKGHDSSSAEELAQHYRTPETRVLIFLAPVPACGNVDQIVQRTYPGSEIRPPRTMDPALFLDDTVYAHLLPAGVPIATDYLELAVRKTLAEPAPTNAAR